MSDVGSAVDCGDADEDFLRARGLRAAIPSQISPLATQGAHGASPEHFCFFRLQVRQARRTRPERVSEDDGSLTQTSFWVAEVELLPVDGMTRHGVSRAVYNRQRFF